MTSCGKFCTFDKNNVRSDLMIELLLDFRRLKFKAAAILVSQVLEELEPEEGF